MDLSIKAETTNLITRATSSSASGLATSQTNVGDMTTALRLI
jgi:hypothetical protein